MNPSSFPWLSSDHGNERENRLVLLEKREKLKVLIKRTQDDINRLKDSDEDDDGDDDIFRKLLESNEVVTKDLQQAQEVQNEGDGMSSNSFLPVREGPESTFLLGLFHGLKFRKISSNFVSRNVHKSEFTGSCYSLSSKVLFNFHISLMAQLPDETVSSFQIRVSPWIRKEIGAFLDKMQREKNISHCLFALAQYGNMMMKRHEVFTSLMRDQPQRLWRGCNFITLTGRSGMELALIWNIEVDEIGNVKSKPKISLKMNDLHDNSIPCKYPSIFKSLVKRKGVLKATSIIYDMIK